MDGAIATAFVEVRPDTTGFGAKLQSDVQPEARRLGSSLGQTIRDGLLTAGIGAALVGSLREADEARDIAAQTAAAIRSTGGAANVTAQQVGELTERLSEQIAVDDDLIQQSANLLLTFTRVQNQVGEGNDIFDRAVGVAQDMASALGTDATSAALQLGKALNDPILGITALGRAGVQFTADQKEQIRTLVESNDVLGAQRIILAELETQVAGSAEAQASALDRITVSTGNLKESIGGALAPVLEQLVPVVETAVGAFERLPPAAQTLTVIGGSLAAGLGPLGRTIDGYRSLTSAIDGVSTSGSRFSGFAGSLARGGLIVGAITGVLALADAFGSVEENISDLSQEGDRMLVDTFRRWQEIIRPNTEANALEQFFNIGDQTMTDTEAAFDRFEQLAEESIGTAQRMRDALAAEGDDVSRLDTILQDAAAAQRQVNSDAAAGQQIIGETGRAFRDSAADVDELSEALSTVDTRIREAFDRMASVEEAEVAFRNTIRAAFDQATSLITGEADDAERRDAFQQFLLDARDDALDLADALGAEGVGSDEVVRRVQALIDEASQLGDDFGLTTGEVDGLRESLGLLPNQVDLIVGGNLAQARADAEALATAVLNLALTPVNTILGVVGQSVGARPGPATGVVGPATGVVVNVTSTDPDRAGESVVRELERQSLLTGPR